MPNRSENALALPDHNPYAIPEHADEPLVLLTDRRDREGQEAVFAVELAGVAANGEEGDPRAFNPEAHTMPRSLESVFAGLSAGEGIELVYRCGKDTPFIWRIIGHVVGSTPAEIIPKARDLCTSLCVGMRAANGAYRFSPIRYAEDLPAHKEHYSWQRQIVARGIAIRKAGKNPVGFVPGATSPNVDRELLLPNLTSGLKAPYNRLALALRQSRTPIVLRLALTKVVLNTEEAAKVSAALEWLHTCEEKEITHDDLVSLGARRQAHIENSRQYLDAWLEHRWGTRLTVTVESESPVTSSLLAMIIEDLALGKDTDLEAIPAEPSGPGVCTATGIDFQNCFPAGCLLPSLFPAPAQLVRAQVRREYNREVPRLGADGVVLGCVNDGARRLLVHFRQSDRSRHTYILGSTGTGKSSLLANMIVQDIRNGHGVCVLDPHGDLYAQIQASIPRERVRDLILVNPCDRERAAGINFLEAGGPQCRMEIHFLVNEMMSIFQRLYLRETQGPVFETYMRNAMLLLMENEIPDATLLDVPRLFEHEGFRSLLLAKCLNPAVQDFWQKTAERARGDYSLASMAPYIVSKLNMFVYNPVIRSIIGQAKSTIDFYQAMNEGRIILVNLSKGFLGELDTQLLGMLITGKVFCAAMKRIAQPAATRKPHFLYIDEFQNFTSGSIAQMMSEARKFGLFLTLANQNLGQLREYHDASSLSEAVLSNAGTLLCFRTGAPDAERIKVHTMPEFDTQDIQYMPDFHVIAKLLVNNSPTRPFVFETLPFESTVAGRGHKRAIENARKRCTVDTREVERAIALRHVAVQGD